MGTKSYQKIKASCQTCVFSRTNDYAITYMECHRYAPIYDSQATVYSMFPSVLPSDWCGEYELDTNLIEGVKNEKTRD